MEELCTSFRTSNLNNITFLHDYMRPVFHNSCHHIFHSGAKAQISKSSRAQLEASLGFTKRLRGIIWAGSFIKALWSEGLTEIRAPSGIGPAFGTGLVGNPRWGKVEGTSFGVPVRPLLISVFTNIPSSAFGLL